MPGDQAAVSPSELQRFASDLKRFNPELNSSGSRLQAQFRHLGETWRDQEHARFALEFEEMESTQRGDCPPDSGDRRRERPRLGGSVQSRNRHCRYLPAERCRRAGLGPALGRRVTERAGRGVR